MMDVLGTILVFLVIFIAPLIFPILLIFPKIIDSRLKSPLSRKQIAKKFSLIWAGLFALMIVVVGVSGNRSTGKSENSANQKKQLSQSALDSNESKIVANSSQDDAENDIFAAGQTTPNNPNIKLAKVTDVIDGDTIEVDLGEGNIQKVRYIGIDAPENMAPGQPTECFAKEATEKNRQLVEGGVVGLEKDVSETDRYGRLLRYVYMGDLFVNQVLVVEGYAHASSYPPDIKYQGQLRQAETKARTEGKGLWSACVSSTPSPIPKSTVTPTKSTLFQPTFAPASNTSARSCTGPDLDCSDFSTQAEAQAFFDSCGFSATYDPMRLDSVKVGDGVPCESLP